MKKIALAQMNVEYGNTTKNITVGEGFIRTAVDQKCDLVCLPELWSTGFQYQTMDKYSELNSSLLEHLQDISNQTGIAICGSFIEKQSEQFFNSFIMMQPNLAKTRYFKKHLFAMMHEDKHFSAGNDNHPFNTLLGLSGMCVCYDLRFPEQFLDLSMQGAEVFLLSAHWPLSRIHHWDVLLQARAIENQAFMIAVNSVGQSGKDIYGGHSTVIAPDGEIILAAPSDEEGLYTTEIDVDIVKLLRQKFVIHH